MPTIGIFRAFAPRICTLMITALLIAANSAVAAPAEAPFSLLYSPETRLVLGEVTEINPAGRIVFKRIRVFDKSTDVPELVDVIVGETELASVRLGETYVVGYSLFHHDRKAGGVAPNRKGAILITSVGLEPALFRDAPVIRKILSLADSEHGRESRQMRRLLIDALSGSNRPLQLLAAGQLAYDIELGERLDSRDRDVIARVGLASGTDNRVRGLLISAAATRPGELGNWSGDAIREVLASTPVGGYPSGAMDPTGLVLLAFAEAHVEGVQVPLGSVTRWLRSPHRLLVEKSRVLLGAKFPADAKKALEEARDDPTLIQETRTYIDDQLRQFERQDAGSGAQQQGPG